MILALTALSLGFLGSFHCIGMCGPIALALPIGRLQGAERILSILLYNAGRILTYALFGLIFGMLGNSFAFFGYQQILSVTLGALILIALLIPKKLITRAGFSTFINSFFFRLKTKLAILFNSQGSKTVFLIGLLNGLLPCGLVYMAVAGAIATGDLFKGAVFMAVFGAGTLPVMLSLPFFGNKLTVAFRTKIRKAVPVLLGAMAVLLILRGLNLGIPYVSPKLTTHQLPACHPPEEKKFCYGTHHNK